MGENWSRWCRWGELTCLCRGLELASWIEARLGRKPLWCGDTGPEVVQRVAWCTGGWAKFLSIAPRVLAWMLLLLAKFLNDHHSAREQGLHFYAAGHHATERGGIRAFERVAE